MSAYDGTRDAQSGVEAVLALHRCGDVHSERHDMGGVGVCAACRSWAAHVAAALAPALAQAWDEGYRACVCDAAWDAPRNPYCLAAEHEQGEVAGQ